MFAAWTMMNARRMAIPDACCSGLSRRGSSREGGSRCIGRGRDRRSFARGRRPGPGAGGWGGGL